MAGMSSERDNMNNGSGPSTAVVIACLVLGLVIVVTVVIGLVILLSGTPAAPFNYTL